MSGKLQDRIAIVTGGSRGIGRGISHVLAEAGAFVVVNYTNNEAAALEVVAGIQGKGGRAEAAQADVGVKADIDRMMDGIEERHGRIDILVNNAGICPFNGFFDIDEETWHRTINVNLGGTFFCSQRAATAMRRNGGGAIVNISTVTSARGSRDQVHYASSKGGINSLTNAMAYEVGKYGIRVNSILCGGVWTDINAHQRTEAAVAGITSRLPLGRAGLPEDLGKAVLFLASPDAEWVTGAHLAVDGGSLTM
ncbi:SDR family NAD(P)-dependent oxidoreductase [Paenibacillus sacheonensis]|uniref:Glucose 1-dehydrogenase n=1 Tax=Paenibacillus sacheonensis TaxID=742054 RepID=A0A7X4YUU6_9BACL|nr:glucose 1-dehydrogenase [Paenibacillus sacheonensis]MBM7567732.1 NAD(P)-dependent dehydrogenase (short-subunit alcohol dehydrogenase family) [Paenibacillus sacheonensis]NBC71994.1 glucose 1-dehydrogenase [Paenibacillus sacheonensis]